MKSVFETEINMPQQQLAELFANPGNNGKWMDDLGSYEPISGEPGMPGSKYRLVQKNGNTEMAFIATMTARNLPYELKLTLEAPNVTVSITGKFVALAPEKTRLISEEVFTFSGLLNKIFGFVVQKDIKAAHHRHMESFKRFAENYK